ncbi:MAG: bifunctional glutamate N-acetyltransferase/amino-acid acetyltransferase ArgJ [Proteobacteria bacterium]|nr:bifunctional glutamate N-acetyltransferase/amino-acid acetyltransferase ArgJ [Pseudomonadota bacterium]
MRLSVAALGLKYEGRPDVLLADFVRGTQVAGVFTRSTTSSAPVLLCRKNLSGKLARGCFVNAGNANAFTGKRGERAALHISEVVAEALGASPSEVFVASTGVVGEPLDSGPIATAMDGLASNLGRASFHDAARAICTTDTYPKGSALETKIGDETVRICGIAKGSGMVAPNMATVLGFVFTDASLEASLLQSLLNEYVETTFNSITVDGDTSTSDTLLLFATQAVRHRQISDPGDEALGDFRRALAGVLEDLALQVVRDGEGATKLVRIAVSEAESNESAKRIALAIANSPLVKTAIAGEDPNWGRVVMAVGKAGEPANREAMSIWFGPHLVADRGERAESYVEDEVAKYMKGDCLEVSVRVGMDGQGSARVWTCDLTHRYISINASYRT